MWIGWFDCRLHECSQRRDELKWTRDTLSSHQAALVDDIARLTDVSAASKTELQRVVEQLHVDNANVSVKSKVKYMIYIAVLYQSISLQNRFYNTPLVHWTSRVELLGNRTKTIRQSCPVQTAIKDSFVWTLGYGTTALCDIDFL